MKSLLNPGRIPKCPERTELKEILSKTNKVKERNPQEMAPLRTRRRNSGNAHLHVRPLPAAHFKGEGSGTGPWLRAQGPWSQDGFKPQASVSRADTHEQKWRGRLTHHIAPSCQGQALLEDGYHPFGPAMPGPAELMPRQWTHSGGPLCMLFLINIHSSGHNGPFKAPALNAC